MSKNDPPDRRLGQDRGTKGMAEQTLGSHHSRLSTCDEPHAWCTLVQCCPDLSLQTMRRYLSPPALSQPCFLNVRSAPCASTRIVAGTPARAPRQKSRYDVIGHTHPFP